MKAAPNSLLSVAMTEAAATLGAPILAWTLVSPDAVLFFHVFCTVTSTLTEVTAPSLSE